MSDDKNSNEIDSPEAMREFALAIRERAKTMSKHSAENTMPHVVTKALWMLSQGASIAKVREITGLSRLTIRRLEWDHSDTLETKRKEFSTSYALAAQEFTDLIYIKAEQLLNDPDQLKEISPDKLALTIGILTDQSAKLLGMATARIEHVKGSSIEDAAAFIQEMKKRIAAKKQESAIEAEVIE